ncbi:glycosyltransferase domain-containing protein [Aquabacterium sp.]|uniref:glycosyltransferase domain-containing protein n=1 Tax=Aquabacterium sp. TaxID=1872578 RepID=UPI0025BE258F|nr:glycosyltransferase domain-containing protein [Aquabacterium sp.]
MVSQTWQIRRIDPALPGDLPRSQREAKLLPHRYLSEFDRSLYIDNSVMLKALPEEIDARWAGSSGLRLCEHSFRKTVADECAEVVRLRRDDPSRVMEWLCLMRRLQPQMLSRRPIWGGMLLRDHHLPLVQRAMSRWYELVLRYSRRDQLSAWWAFDAVGLKPDVQRIDNLDAWSHNWPVVEARDEQLANFDPLDLQWPPDDIRALLAKLARLERENARLTTQIEWHRKHQARTWFSVSKPKILR